MSERKTVIITGVASGIGFETARRFSEDPKYTTIIVADINPSVYKAFPQSEYPNLVPLQVDVRSKEEIETVLQRAVLESGRLDVIVNGAGVMYKGKPEAYWDKSKQPPQEWKEMDEVNVWAPIQIMTEAPKIMRENGGGTNELPRSKLTGYLALQPKV